ncbi:unnamed protein product [Protopolystoma xenopodis]|uniref:Uncharacterized protein n=1 Tax=Protopolystoma xenopodis TaxID=117903 RepID=A0A448XG89_9PLAT|nr:unnamed protein product [Protopolystoma xenopodis]
MPRLHRMKKPLVLWKLNVAIWEMKSSLFMLKGSPLIRQRIVKPTCLKHLSYLLQVQSQLDSENLPKSRGPLWLYSGSGEYLFSLRVGGYPLIFVVGGNCVSALSMV